MLDIVWPVKLATDHTVHGFWARSRRAYVPNRNKLPATRADLAVIIAAFREAISALPTEWIDALVDGEIMHVPRGITFSTPAFLTGFLTPNFYFTLVTAYDDLRANDLPVGKADHLGRLPCQSPLRLDRSKATGDAVPNR